MALAQGARGKYLVEILEDKLLLVYPLVYKLRVGINCQNPVCAQLLRGPLFTLHWVRLILLKLVIKLKYQ